MKKTILISIISTLLFLSACTKDQEISSQRQEKSGIVPNGQELAGVPLPAGHDIVNLFFNLINEKRIPEAIEMMSETAVPDDSAKQAWGVQFNAIKSISVIDIEPWDAENWTDGKQVYKATLEAYVTNDSSAPIPYYGWEDNPNIRWVSLEKDNQNMWKIANIATGP